MKTKRNIAIVVAAATTLSILFAGFGATNSQAKAYSGSAASQTESSLLTQLLSQLTSLLSQLVALLSDSADFGTASLLDEALPEEPVSSSIGTASGSSFILESVSEGISDFQVTVDSSVEVRYSKVSGFDMGVLPNPGVKNFTVSGLKPSITYYKYVNTFEDEEVLASDAQGSLYFSADTTNGALVWLHEKKSTIIVHSSYIGPGNRCAVSDITGQFYGSWNPTTMTCTLDTNTYTESIVVASQDTTLDCANSTFVGPYTFADQFEIGILAAAQRTTVTNCNVTGWVNGIAAAPLVADPSVAGTVITGNAASFNYYGIIAPSVFSPTTDVEISYNDVDVTLPAGFTVGIITASLLGIPTSNISFLHNDVQTPLSGLFFLMQIENTNNFLAEYNTLSGFDLSGVVLAASDGIMYRNNSHDDSGVIFFDDAPWLKNVSIIDNDFVNSSRGITTCVTEGLVIDSNTFDEVTRPITVNNSCDFAGILDSPQIINNSFTGGDVMGIYVEGIDGGVITDNTLNALGGEYRSGFTCADCNNSDITDNVINFQDHSLWCINMVGPSENNNILRNTCSNSEYVGLSFDPVEGPYNAIARNNLVEGNEFYNTGSGVWLTGSTAYDNTFRNNLIVNDGGVGFELVNAPDNTIVMNDILVSNGTPLYSHDGLGNAVAVDLATPGNADGHYYGNWWGYNCGQDGSLFTPGVDSNSGDDFGEPVVTDTAPFAHSVWRNPGKPVPTSCPGNLNAGQ